MSRPGFALAIFATLLAAVVVMLGAYTRLTHAGLGCPDWPGCYGFLSVPMSERAQEVAALRFPDAPLEITGPGEESGTYSSFVELALEDLAEAQGVPEEEFATRPDYQASADDNIIIQGIQGSDTSLGWVGFAFAREAEGVQVIEVDGGDGCVEPTDETIADNSYPLSRPLFIYTSEAVLTAAPQATGFLNFLFENIDIVADAGYITLPDELLAAQTAKLGPYR